MSKRRRVVIEFTSPDRARHADVDEFIVDELSSSGGCRHSDDPLFHSLADVKIINADREIQVSVAALVSAYEEKGT